MPTSRDDFFRVLREETTQERFETARRDSFEHRVVRYLLKWGEALSSADLGETAKPIRPPHNAGLSWFTETYTLFPLKLFAQRVPWTHSVRGADLFGKDFAKLPFVKAFGELAQEHDCDLQKDFCGLVFAWPKVKGGNMMILHNYPPEAENVADPFTGEGRGSCLIRELGKPPIRHVLETLQDCLLNVGPYWYYRT